VQSVKSVDKHASTRNPAIELYRILLMFGICANSTLRSYPPKTRASGFEGSPKGRAGVPYGGVSLYSTPHRPHRTVDGGMK